MLPTSTRRSKDVMSEKKRDIAADSRDYRGFKGRFKGTRDP
jgi:hypothetical protein